MSKYQLDRIKLNAIELKLSDAVTLAVPESLQSITAYVLLEQERWFEKEMDFLRHWLRPGMTVIDIGANLGVYSVPMARLVGQTGHVFAYEPGSEARRLLERNRELNAAVNLDISPLALSDRERDGRLVFGGSSELYALGDSGAVKWCTSPVSIGKTPRAVGRRLILSRSMRRARRTAFSPVVTISSRDTRR